MRDVVISALKEIKEIGPFIIGKFVYDEKSIFCRISQKLEKYQNGCDCNAPLFHMDECFICLHICILKSAISKKLVVQPRGRLNKTISGNGPEMRKDLIYAIFHIAEQGGNVNRLIRHLSSQCPAGTPNDYKR